MTIIKNLIMKKLLVLPMLLLFFVVTSCSSSSEDEVIITPANDVTYTGDIKVIIDSSCLNCHSDPPINSAPMSLTTYQDVKESVMNRDLIGRIENGSMPPSGANLAATQLQAIKDWEVGGFKQ